MRSNSEPTAATSADSVCWSKREPRPRERPQKMFRCNHPKVGCFFQNERHLRNGLKDGRSVSFSHLGNRPPTQLRKSRQRSTATPKCAVSSTEPSPASLRFVVRMKVALVVHDFDSTYGQGRYCVEIVRLLREQVQFTVYASFWNDAAIPDDVVIRRVPAWRARALTTIFSFIPLAELAVRRGRHDLIHSQGLTCWSADVITGHVCNAARLKQTPLTQIKSRRSMKLVIPLERAFYRQRRARRLIAISRVMAREITEEYGWNRPVDLIYHGTNLTQFRPARDSEEKRALRQQYRLPADGWVWVFAGEAVKGLSEVLKQLPHFPEAHLLVLTRSSLAAFQDEANRLGISGRVTFHGFELQPELAFRASDTFVYPSRYDTFGMVGAEAMASGLSVVLGRDIGVAELIDAGRNGMVCSPQNPSDLRAQLSRLAESPGFGIALGRAARKTIERYDWDACARATLKSYETAIRDRESQS
ncbi:MAG: glycosyltransferase family 1 protein [Pedosphaera sp.]|nr:glycosyltransferase family 1 protein [Pedosphaera sp.]